MKFKIFSTSRAALIVLAALAASGCATKLNPPITGYACCNLRSYYGSVSAANFLSGPILPAGEAVLLDTTKRDQYFYGTIGGEYVTVYDGSSRDQGSPTRWLHQVVVQVDPRPRLASWPQDIQNAIRSGKVMVGMTRAQVLMALSYPSLDDTKDIRASTWRYWVTAAGEDTSIDVQFDPADTVRSLSGTAAAIRLVEYKQ